MSAAVFKKQGITLTVIPKGRLDSVTGPLLAEELKAYLDGVREITMDFAEVEYISSGGMRMLMTKDKQMKECGGSMRVIHVDDSVFEIFELVGLIEILTIERE